MKMMDLKMALIARGGISLNDLFGRCGKVMRRSLGVASHWPFEAWGRFLPEQTTAASMLDRLIHHAVVVVTEGDSYRMREAKTRGRPRRTDNHA